MSKVGTALVALGVSAFGVVAFTAPALVRSNGAAPAPQQAASQTSSSARSAAGRLFALSASPAALAPAPPTSTAAPSTAAADAVPAPPTATAAPSPSPAPSAGTVTGPALPRGVSGTLVSEETGAQLYADPAWQNSLDGQIEPASSCTAWSPATMTVSGTNLDMYTPGSPSWDCVALESDAAMTPGHIWQLSEYIPAMANGLIADYPSWWMTDASWSSEVDMAEAQDWGGNNSPQGAMCLDIHLDQGTRNTSPDCVTETGGWHTYTFVWAADGAVTMYYDGTKVSPEGVSGTTATDMHMIIWNNDNGGIGSTLALAYLATWDDNG